MSGCADRGKKFGLILSTRESCLKNSFSDGIRIRMQVLDSEMELSQTVAIDSWRGFN